MTGQKYDRIVATSALLVALIAAIPVVYNFEKQRFFWQTGLPDKPIQQQQNIKNNANVVL